MSSIIYPSSFSTTPVMTLHNGSSHLSSQLVVQSARARLNLRQLPNGVIYDLGGTTQAPLLPPSVTAEVVIELATKAAVVAEYEAWGDHVGKKETLTGTKISGGTMTCMAWLEQLEIVSPFPTNIDTQLTVRLLFRPTTNWV